jgi:cellulose synthase/poly-beta-1,6-N-acetylglucosamine synthase-like glycosyltransferase
MNGSVTIITPVYNAMPYLPNYLDSLLYQDHRPLEVILVNDGSDDDSLNVMEAGGGRVTGFFASETNRPPTTDIQFHICAAAVPKSLLRKLLFRDYRSIKEKEEDITLLLDKYGRYIAP